MRILQRGSKKIIMHYNAIYTSSKIYMQKSISLQRAGEVAQYSEKNTSNTRLANRSRDADVIHQKLTSVD